MEASTQQKTQQHRMTRKMKQNSPHLSHCRHDDKFRGFMRTWDKHIKSQLVFKDFTEIVESDGNRREVTSLEAPWRSDKTERAGRDCKEDYCKMTQDGSEGSMRKVFEEDRVTVNQTKASKNNDSRYSEYQRILYRWKMPFWNVEEKA